PALELDRQETAESICVAGLGGQVGAHLNRDVEHSAGTLREMKSTRQVGRRANRREQRLAYLRDEDRSRADVDRLTLASVHPCEIGAREVRLAARRGRAREG